MSRKILIAGNWKMNPAPLSAQATPKQAPETYLPIDTVDTAIFPTFLDITKCIDAGIITAGHPEESGAHTGDVSMKMLKEIGCKYVLCGHSERRQDHYETNEFVSAQVSSAIENDLMPILCVGETEEERQEGKEKVIVKKQIETVIERSAIRDPRSDLVIAYEPVWAIGTGKTATPEDAQEMHAYIRSLLPEDIRDETRILYGGSMKPENAKELLGQPDIDGGLVGGASLKPESFLEIIKSV
jgi:triosephosphate isomerase